MLPAPALQNRQDEVAKARSRVVVSGIAGQAQACAALVATTDTSVVEHVLLSNQFDDAGMWFRSPMTKEEERLVTDAQKFSPACAKSLVEKHPNRFLPVLNMSQGMFTRRAFIAPDGRRQGTSLRGADIMSPAVPLPAPLEGATTC